MKAYYWLVTTFLVICLAPYSLQDPTKDTGVSQSQGWQDEYQPQEYRGEKEEENVEEETTRRPRGKRRRRMRKRQRTQVLEEDVERIINSEQNQEGTDGSEVVTPEEDIPRRRPGKRRRRPYRRYQDDDSSPIKPLRRRRKGGRKKVRPENQEEEAQTIIPSDETKNEETFEQETTTQALKTTESPLPSEETTIIPKIVLPTVQVKKEEPNELKVVNNAVRTDNEDSGKSVPYGSKIFDRKKLFSNPRRTLPVTSAVIRKYGAKINISDSSTAQLESRGNFESKIIENSLIKLNSVQESNTKPPDIIKPERLVNSDNKNNIQSEETSEAEDEEPNYPKIIPRPLFNKNKTKYIATTTTEKSYMTTEKVDTTSQPEQLTEDEEVQTSSPMMSDSEFEKMLETLDVDSHNLTHFDDYILDLLQTKNGKERLTKILESRNMTVTQLLEHRERGSSKFHLFQMFPNKTNNERTTRPTSTESSISETPKVLQGKKEIQFPSEEVLGSFPQFITDEIAKNEQNTNKKKIVENGTEASASRESREPRLFDSMPEFTTLSMTSTTRENKHPTWRIIPNPKLQPVSIRGNYEEIPIGHVLNRPIENNVNDIYIVDEREALIHKKKFGLSSYDTIKSKDPFGNFKKIPVGVKSAIIISGIILAVATFGFLSLLISCRVRQKRSILRAKQDMMCEHLQNDDFMTSQQSLSPVLTKHQHQQVYNPHQEHHSHPNNRNYYLWRTIRRTFRYE